MGRYLPLEACSCHIYKVPGKGLASLHFFLFREKGVSSSKVSTEVSTNVPRYVLHKDKVNLVNLIARTGKPDCRVWVRSCQLVTLGERLNFTVPQYIFVYKLKMMLLSTLGWARAIYRHSGLDWRVTNFRTQQTTFLLTFHVQMKLDGMGVKDQFAFFLFFFSFWAPTSLELNM